MNTFKQVTKVRTRSSKNSKIKLINLTYDISIGLLQGKFKYVRGKIKKGSNVGKYAPYGHTGG